LRNPITGNRETIVYGSRGTWNPYFGLYISECTRGSQNAGDPLRLKLCNLRCPARQEREQNSGIISKVLCQ
jgi:hypothetical protein